MLHFYLSKVCLCKLSVHAAELAANTCGLDETKNMAQLYVCACAPHAGVHACKEVIYVTLGEGRSPRDFMIT